MVEVKRLPNHSHYCAVCDREAVMAVSDTYGGLKVFWASGPNDSEFPLCDSCARELRDKLAAVIG